MPQAVLYSEGQSAAPGDFSPGDFILTHGSAWYSKVIRKGQGIRYKGESDVFDYYNHAALIIDESGTILQAMNAGIVKGHIKDYQDSEYHLVKLGNRANDLDRKRMVAFAKDQTGKPYDWLCIFGIALSLLVRTSIIFNMEGRYICSGFVAFALLRASIDLPYQPQHMMPADLAYLFDVRPAGNGK